MSDSQTEHYETDYKVGQDNIQRFGMDIHNPVFMVSACAMSIMVAIVLIFNQEASDMFGSLKPWLTKQFDWVFMIGVNIFVLFCLLLIVSPMGKIRIGGKDAKPEFSYLGWFAMLFAAGMGIGLVFYGVLEPMNHTLKPPLGQPGLVDEAGNIIAANIDQAKSIGMAGTFVHWNIHPWAIYSVVALALAIFCYNKKLPLSIRSAFYPLLGERTWGWPGHLIDITAVFATLAGLATSLGIGAGQASAGLNYLFDTGDGLDTKIIVVLVITAIALISVLRGLNAGVKLLSEVNMIMALLLMLFVFAIGPTMEILSGIGSNIVTYVEKLPALSNWVGREDSYFLHDWSTTYWAWWIAWSPFVGMFIARISKGRTVREFIVCVILIPSLVSSIWMTVFGTTAIEQFISDGYTGVVDTITNWAPELALFKMLDELPFTTVTSVLGIILVVVFFITSLDSGALVIDMITSGGKTDAPTRQRVFWCCFEATIAITLLVGGGLVALQAFSIAMGFPFCLVLMLMCVSLWKGLSSELTLLKGPPHPSPQQ
ncbi:BCCT family transporter [Porticoccus sp. W117]|uniref:BCCT family transporter n=1 Tax=Porticoccus sp. W117 TaxID=3054777 RepID=UPI002591D7ED|nr:BCCT family transporter [Porticoccus sp. W117]MDM3871389.1 BCCT family transporter [Porticoccus sp. W117]